MSERTGTGSAQGYIPVAVAVPAQQQAVADPPGKRRRQYAPPDPAVHHAGPTSGSTPTGPKGQGASRPRSSGLLSPSAVESTQ